MLHCLCAAALSVWLMEGAGTLGTCAGTLVAWLGIICALLVCVVCQFGATAVLIRASAASCSTCCLSGNFCATGVERGDYCSVRRFAVACTTFYKPRLSQVLHNCHFLCYNAQVLHTRLCSSRSSRVMLWGCQWCIGVMSCSTAAAASCTTQQKPVGTQCC
jgi:hypothetical protein